MPDRKTTAETLRTPVDGTESLRLATPGSNWKVLLTNLKNLFNGVTSGTVLFSNSGVADGDADLTWDNSLGSLKGKLSINGGLFIQQPADYSQNVTFDMHTFSYVNVECDDPGGGSGFSFVMADAIGNYGVGYLIGGHNSIQLQSPYNNGAAAFGSISLQIGQSTGGSYAGLIVSPTAAGLPYNEFYASISTRPGALTCANGANNNLVIPAVTSGGPTSFARITGPTGAFSISGFVALADGEHLWVYNTTAQDMTITNKAGSGAGSQINTLTGADVTLTGESMAHFIYDVTTGYWLLASTQG